ncbi:MAG TPA: hypothetical protein PLZ12_19595 [Saprospiraceae bacterium]|nr:hypothetical protein [Saprospiraceae bacterium]
MATENGVPIKLPSEKLYTPPATPVALLLSIMQLKKSGMLDPLFKLKAPTPPPLLAELAYILQLLIKGDDDTPSVPCMMIPPPMPSAVEPEALALPPVICTPFRVIAFETLYIFTT